MEKRLPAVQWHAPAITRNLSYAKVCTSLHASVVDLHHILFKKELIFLRPKVSRYRQVILFFAYNHV